MNRINLSCATTLYIVVAALAQSGMAGAANVNATSITNAVGICQSALPVFDGLIRKRPLAIQNEGSSAAFVTCAMTLTLTSNTFATRATVWARSNDGADHQLSCTGVTGYAIGNTQMVAKSVTVPANGNQASLSWVPSDFTGGSTNFPSALFSMSCLLLPGVGLNDTYLDFPQYIGS